MSVDAVAEAIAAAVDAAVARKVEPLERELAELRKAIAVRPKAADKRMLSAQKAARIAGVGRDRLRSAILARELRAVINENRGGKTPRYLIDPADLDHWIERRGRL